MAIRAPFNFVPVSDKVFFPDWADQIQHDIPFSDGVSGTIKLKITAESPIFVRNGHTEKDREEKNENYQSFSNVEGQYFIPGTSIKGAIRNVLEILSFGKMQINEKAKFAQREWDNGHLYPLKRKQNEFHCGWIKRGKKGDDFIIEDCGKPYRIAHTRIDEWMGNNLFRKNFSKNDGIDLNKNHDVDGKTFDPKTARYKYHLVGSRNLSNINFEIDNEFSNEYKDNRVKVSKSEFSEIQGTIVLTGQPDKWQWPRPRTLTKGAGKFYEFVFQDQNLGEYQVSKQEFDHFKFIYSESEEWPRIYELIETEKGAPVFFRVENKKIKDFGLAFLYKLPYDKSPHDTLSDNHKEEKKLDLAECIFGTTNKNFSLKGRVTFSNAKCIESQIHNELIFTMGSPKASYYPIYIEQKNGINGKTSNYSTYNDSKIKGWKRYQIRESIFGNKQDYNEKLDSKLIPLDKGATFECKVSFHNLRPIEFAALYSAITFHKTEGCYHQIGQGKPFGLGKIKVEISEMTPLKLKIDDSLADFENILSDLIEEEWYNNKIIEELFTLAKIPVVDAESALFNYMKMSTNRDDNEFQKAKKAGEFLRYYTELKKRKASPESLAKKKNEEKDIRKKAEEEERLRQQKLKEEQELKEAEEKAKKEAEAIRQQQIEAGLSFLEERFETGNYKVTDFKGAKNRIEQWMKKANHEMLPDKEHERLLSFLQRIFKGIVKENERQEWKTFNKGVWAHVSNWIGQEKAFAFFNQIIND